MRVLDVSPRVTFPPTGGSQVRVYNLLRHLSRRHEVRQFSQVRLDRRWERRAAGEEWLTPTYCEHRWRHPLGALVSLVGDRSWVTAPVLSGAALRIGRPTRLRELLRWSEVTLVEFPWQFEHCRRQHPAAPLVLASHNVEAEKFASWAVAAGAGRTRAAWLRGIEHAEARAVRGADLILAVSEEDRQGLARRYDVDARRIVVVPNGADTER